MASYHGTERVCVEMRHLGQGEDGCSQGTESHRGGVADQCQFRSFQWAESNANQKRTRDGDRGAKSSGSLDEGSEAEGDQ